MDMRCYCKILHISYKDHVTNEDVLAKVQQVIEPNEDLLIIEEKRKLKWYEYVSRPNRLARYSERGKKTRQTEKEMGRHQGMDRDGVRQV